MTKETEKLYRNRHRPITGMLTNDEYEQFKAIAYEHKMLPTTYATYILRETLNRGQDHEHQ